jgi:hypothetical protein
MTLPVPTSRPVAFNTVVEGVVAMRKSLHRRLDLDVGTHHPDYIL